MFLIRTGYRSRVVGATIGLSLTLFFLADDQFITRQQTTADYREDNSAQERLQSWLGAVHLVEDHPLGAGGRGFHLLSPIYIPEIVEAHGGDLRAPHNTFAMLPAEWGIAGLICFIGLHVSVFRILRRVKQRSAPGDPGHYYWWALAIQLALIAHLGASVFSDRLYGEAGYWMIGLAFALYRMQATDLAEKAAPESVAHASQPASSAGAWPFAGAPAR
jgi:O-antigen ligase